MDFDNELDEIEEYLIEQVIAYVLVACTFDIQICYVYAGWEGSIVDARVLKSALEDPYARFPHPPEGKYYVVDAGYANTKGFLFLAPYQGVRYHLQYYRGSKNPPRTKKELYNHRHSSLRNVIERCFGVLKSRFMILKSVSAYPFETQRDIVFAACVLHNYIRLEGKNDWIFIRYENMADENVPSEENDQVEVVASRPSACVQRVNQRQASLLRDSIAHDLWSARD